MDSFSKIKIFKSLNEVIESFFNIKNFKSRKKVTEFFFSVVRLHYAFMIDKFPRTIFFLSIPIEILWL